MTEIFSLKAIGAFITSFWARSAILLWCLAAICLAFLIALAAGAHWQVGDMPALFAKYSTTLGFAFLALILFGAFKTYSERPKPILSLLPEEHSFCAQSRQPDGKIATHLALRFHATNLTDGAIMLLAIELRRPRVPRRAILTKVILNNKRPIEPQSLTNGSATIFISRPVGSVGKTIRVVVAVQDHAGRWHKLIFPHLPVRGTVGLRPGAPPP